MAGRSELGSRAPPCPCRRWPQAPAEHGLPLPRAAGALHRFASRRRRPRSANCRTIEGGTGHGRAGTARAAPARRRAASARAEPSAGSTRRRSATRDSDARRILEDELQREEARLDELRKEYNNGEPERRASERNYQSYLDRVAEMKAGIARKESDIAAIKRELAKLPQ